MTQRPFLRELAASDTAGRESCRLHGRRGTAGCYVKPAAREPEPHLRRITDAADEKHFPDLQRSSEVLPHTTAVALQACACGPGGSAPAHISSPQKHAKLPRKTRAHNSQSATAIRLVEFVLSFRTSRPAQPPAIQLWRPHSKGTCAATTDHWYLEGCLDVDALLQLQILPCNDYITYSCHAVKYHLDAALPSNRPTAQRAINLFHTPSDNRATRHASFAVSHPSTPHTHLDPAR